MDNESSLQGEEVHAEEQTFPNRSSLKSTVMGKLMPFVRTHLVMHDDLDQNISKPINARRNSKPINSFSNLVSMAASSILGRVKIDSRHMWIAKRIAQSTGDTVPLSVIEETIASPLHLAKINDFLGPFGTLCLFLSLSRTDSVTLRIEFQPFDVKDDKMLYIVRVGNEGSSLPVESFEQSVLFGEFRSGVKSLALIIQNVYAPLLRANEDWGSSTLEDQSMFKDELSKFSTTLAGIVCTIDSRAHLTMPEPEILAALKSSTWNRKDLKLLEEVALSWKSAAESVLNEGDPTLRSLLDVRPDAPLLFWRQRLANLNSLGEQFEAVQTRELVTLLEAAGSPLVAALSAVEDRIREAALEANETVKHLSTLDKHFQVLYDGSVSKIGEVVGGIFLKIKRVRVMSKYLQQTENMNGLLVKITNQIILRCKAYIKEDGGLWEQDCERLLARLKECIKLNDLCQAHYRNAKHERTGAARELPFAFDECQIFVKFELFAERLGKLIEIFNVFDFFQKLASQDILDVRSVCTRYFHTIDEFSSRPYDLLDYTDTLFDSDCEALSASTLLYEKELCKAMDRCLQSVQITDKALDLLSEFDRLLSRHTLRPYLHAKKKEILEKFEGEMESVANMYEMSKTNPPLVRNAPPVAGKIMWVRQLLKLLELPMQKLRGSGTLVASPKAKVVIKKYNRIAKALVDYEVLWEQAWCSVCHSAKQSLNMTLLTFHPESRQLQVNFNTQVLQVFRECHFMRRLQIQLPGEAQSMMERELELKQYLDSLVFMVSLYEKCQGMVLPEFKVLFDPLLSELNHVIKPGLESITWTSVHVSSFLANVSKFLTKFQFVVDRTRDVYDNQVSRGLRDISRCLLVAVPNQISTLDDFAGRQSRVLQAGITAINLKSSEIEAALKDCVSSVLLFSPTSSLRIRPNALAIHEFYDSVWELLFNAVLTSVKRSINALKEQIRSSQGVGFWLLDRPLFEVNVQLVSHNIQTNPSLEDVQHAINCCALAILRSLDVKFWETHQSNIQPRPTIADRVRASKEIVLVILLLTGCIRKTTSSVNSYLDTLKRFQVLWVHDTETENSRKQPELGDYISMLSFYEELAQEVSTLPSACSIGPVCLVHGPFKVFLQDHIRDLKSKVCNNLYSQAVNDLKSCTDWFEDMFAKLTIKIHDLDDVRNITVVVRDISSKAFAIETQFNMIDAYFCAAQEFAFTIPETALLFLHQARSQWAQLNSISNSAFDNLRTVQEALKSDLMKSRILFYREVKQFCSEFFKDGPLDPSLGMAVATTRLKSFQERYNEKVRKIASLREGEELFGLSICKYTELDDVKASLASLNQLYSLHLSIILTIEEYKSWSLSKFSDAIDVVELEVQSFSRKIGQVPQDYKDYLVFKDMAEQVEQLRTALPVLKQIVHSRMQTRHWEEIMIITGTTLNFMNPEFSLREIMEINLPQFSKEICSIAVIAQNESNCIDRANSINNKWQSYSLSFQNFKSLGPILLDFTDTKAAMDSIEECQVNLTTLLETKYSTRFRSDILQTRSKLASLYEILDLWLDVQIMFCSVDAVLSSADAIKQLPQEVSRFQSVGQSIAQLCHDAHTLQSAIALVHEEDKIRAMLHNLRHQLEASQVCLVEHLNQKREVFPRLHFVPDSLLLEILSCGPQNLSKSHVLSFLFDSVATLIIDNGTPNDDGSSIWVSAVGSKEGEIVNLGSPIMWDEKIEVTLAGVQKEMITIVKGLVQLIQFDLSDWFDSEKLNDFTSQYPCQACIIGFQCWWSLKCVDTFMQGARDLTSILEKLSSILVNIFTLLGPLVVSSKDRYKLESLLECIFVHQDITQNLGRQGMPSIDSFEWQKQLRFRWNQTSQTCEVQSLNHISEHSYEYIGCKAYSSIPYLSNRVCLFIFESLNSRMGCRLAGLSGRCKTEMLRDLGRQLGRFSKALVSCPSMQHEIFQRFLKGIYGVGAWGCFDKIERMSSNLLSLIAGCLVGIIGAQRSAISSHIFADGFKISLHKNAAMFACSTLFGKPDFSDSLFPEEWRQVFRSITFVPPDHFLFVCIKLSIARFANVRSIANKISCIYHICVDVFGTCRQYNFSFRNLQRVLDQIVLFKSLCNGKEGEFKEIQAAENALRIVHLPSFAKEDVPIYLMYLSKIFGECNLRYGLTAMRIDLEHSLELMDTKENWKIFPDLKMKVVQMLDVSNVKHCFIMCGPTCTGKSISLKFFLNRLSEMRECTQKALVINPMATSYEHFFGWLDAKSSKWYDGVFTCMWKRAARSNNVNTWLVLDGPMQSIWIENFETVFDDAKTLFLANGDQLQLDDSMRVVLEVCDLRGCSPSTVTKIGIISFSEPLNSLGAIAEGWLRERRTEEADLLRPLLSALVNPMCRFIDSECRPLVRIENRARMQSFLALLSALLSNSVLVDEMPDPYVLERYVIYALGWTLMGTLDENDRHKAHKKFLELSGNVPAARKNRTLLDYELVDTALERQSWSLLEWNGLFREAGAEKMLQAGTHCLSHLFVPTITNKGLFALNRLLQNTKFPLFVYGEVGCGKSTLASNCMVESPGVSKSCSVSRIILSKSDTSYILQELFFRRLIKKNGQVLGPAHGPKLIIIIEDINLPPSDNWGHHPISEFLRSFLERASLFSPKRPDETFEVHDVGLIGTMLSQMPGRAHIPDSLLRHVFTAYILNSNKESIKCIFEPALLGRFGGDGAGSLPHDTATAIKVCLDAMSDLILALRHKLGCSRFNLHCAARITKGILQVRSEELNTPLAVISLWYHECEREILDGLRGSAQLYFEECAKKTMIHHFGFAVSSTGIKHQVWTSLLSSKFDKDHKSDFSGLYRAVQTFDELGESSLKLLKKFNFDKSNSSEKLNLFLFRDLVLHLIRLARILSLERGHAALVSDAGTGKLSITRLVAYFISAIVIKTSKCEQSLLPVLKNNLKAAYLTAARNGIATILVFHVDSKTPEDVLDFVAHSVSSINLDLFSSEEWGAISSNQDFQLSIDNERSVSEYTQSIDSQLLYAHRIQRFCHFVISCSMSPAEFYVKVSKFPALLCHCTVDVWSVWSSSSLESYALKNLDKLALSLEEHRLNVANPYIESELLKKIQNEREKDQATGSGLEQWNSTDIAQAIAEAMGEEAILREGLMSKVRESIPKQMAHLHIALVQLSRTFHARGSNAQHNESDQKSFCSFIWFRHYVQVFCEIFAERFEDIYSKHLKLKGAIEALESCDRDILALHSSASIFKSKTVEAAMTCDSILQDIKTRVTELQEEKVRRLAYDDQRRDIEIQFDEIKSNVENRTEYFKKYAAQLTTNSMQFTSGTLTDLAGMNPPPNLVTRLFDILLILLRKRINSISVISIRGRAVFHDSWTEVLELMENSDIFLSDIQGLKYFELDAEQIELLQPYLLDEDFAVEKARTVLRGQCVPLIRWIKNIESFCKEYQQSLPLISKFEKMRAQLNHLGNVIPKITQKIEELSVKVDDLRKKYDDAVAMRHVQESLDESRRDTLRRAQDLIKALKPQKGRWASDLQLLDTQRQNLAGNCSICAAFLSYCGWFDGCFRKMAMDGIFPESCSLTRVSYSAQLDAVRFILDESKLNKLRKEGIPSDAYCEQSALISLRCKVWPLMIDPHEVVSDWVVSRWKRENGSVVRLVRQHDEKFIPILKECSVCGLIVLVQDVDEDTSEDLLDLLLFPHRNCMGKESTVRIANVETQIHPLFRLYLNTENMYPTFSESFASLVMIVDFTLPDSALEMRLLDLVLQAEQPAVFRDRLDVLLSDSDVSVCIQEKRAHLIDLMCSLEGKILDKNDVVDSIDQLKYDLQNMAKQRGENLKKLEKIQTIQQRFAPVAKRAKQILSCISKILHLSNLYSFSMPQCSKLISAALREKKNSAGKERSQFLIDAVTVIFLRYVSSMIMSAHSTPWKLLLAMHIDSDYSDDIEAVLQFVTSDLQSFPSPGSEFEFEFEFEWLSSDAIFGLQKLVFFLKDEKIVRERGKVSLEQMLVKNCSALKKWYKSERPEIEFAALENAMEKSFTPLERILFIQCLRKDRFYQAAIDYVKLMLGFLGADQTEPNRELLGSSHVSSTSVLIDALQIGSSCTPIILVSPIKMETIDVLQKVADERGVICKVASLGENQTSIVKNHLNSGLVLGMWIILVNCTIDCEFLSSLPSFLERVGNGKENFRLFLMFSSANDAVPQCLVRKSVVRFPEAPVCLKPIMSNLYEKIEPSFLASMKDATLLRFFFSLSFVFGIVKGRLQYKDTGWSIPYCFDDSTFIASMIRVSEAVLRIFIKSGANSQNSIPWVYLQKMTSELYFNRIITDERDKIILDTYIQRFISPKILADDFEFLPLFVVPVSTNIQGLLSSLAHLPDMDEACNYGLPLHSDTEKVRKYSETLLQTVAAVSKHHDSSTFWASRVPLLDTNESLLHKFFDQVIGIYNSVSEKVSNFSKFIETYSVESIEEVWMMFAMKETTLLLGSLETVTSLVLKCKSPSLDDNRVLDYEVSALGELRKGCVPGIWARVSWPARSLASWLGQLRNRWIQLRSLLEQDSFPSFWIGGFFNPVEFVRITALEAALDLAWPVEEVCVTLEIAMHETRDTSNKLVHGIFIAGAAWDSRAGKLTCKLQPGLSSCPEMMLVPRRTEDYTGRALLQDSLIYRAPCFKAGSRAADDYILDALLPTNEPHQKLVLCSCSVFLNHESLFEAVE